MFDDESTDPLARWLAPPEPAHLPTVAPNVVNSAAYGPTQAPFGRTGSAYRTSSDEASVTVTVTVPAIPALARR